MLGVTALAVDFAVGGKAELLTGQAFDLGFILFRQQLVDFPRFLARRRCRHAAFDLLAVKQIIQVQNALSLGDEMLCAARVNGG